MELKKISPRRRWGKMFKAWFDFGIFVATLWFIGDAVYEGRFVEALMLYLLINIFVFLKQMRERS